MKLKLLRKTLRPPKSRIGMDIGSYAVKMVELLQKEKDVFKIENIGYAKVEEPNSKDSVIHAIKESLSKASPSNKEVYIAVSGPSVIIRFIEFPRMNESELRNSVPFEAEKYIPFGINEVVIDHQLLIPHLGDNKMLVLLVAAKKDLITERLNLAREAGLSVGTLGVASFANTNAFLADPQRKKDNISALIDIGATATDINIIDDDIPYFTRCVQLGGNDFTNALSNALSIDFKSAEDIKIDPKERLDEVSKLIEGVANNIINEIRLSFSYYENQSGKNIEAVYLTGGSAKIANFHTMLKKNLGTDITLWDPIGFMETDPRIDAKIVTSIRDRLGVAAGLAIR